MRVSCRLTLKGLLFVGLLWGAGCSDSDPKPELTVQTLHPPAKIIHAGFAPAKVSILPLTRLVSPSAPDSEPYIQAYVTLTDALGVQLIYPGTFRFELYGKIQRSAEPKGKRVTIWPDMDLTTLEENHRYWQDVFRAYEFHLDVTAPANQKYILQVTFLGVEDKRLSAQAELEL